MSRRQATSSRRFPSTGSSYGGPSRSKSRISPLLCVVLIFLGAIFIVGYYFRGSGVSGGTKLLSRIEGDFTCTFEVQRATPILKQAYGDNMHKVLHVGPDTCSVVSKLLEQEETEAWGVEPYDIEEADADCRRLVRKGIVRVADIKFPLPYRENSFSLVIVSDAVEYLSPKYLNKTLPELARVSSDGLVIFTGFPGHPRPKTTEPSRYGRPAKKRTPTWWLSFFVRMKFEEDEGAVKRFVKAAVQNKFKPECQVFQLRSNR